MTSDPIAEARKAMHEAIYQWGGESKHGRGVIKAAADAYALAVLDRVERLFCDQTIDPDEAMAQVDALRVRLEGSHDD